MSGVGGGTSLGRAPARRDAPVAPGLRYKRPLDLALLALVVLAGLPLWLLVAVLAPLAIWLDDRGPIFFRQVRVGKDGRWFTFLKFRTMAIDAERQGLWTREDDPRVTRTGRVLRRTAVDELPQLINILKGEMSWVGPRALPTEMQEDALKEEPRFAQRLQVQPGATGVAQLYLPRHCSPRLRLRYDLLYIKNVGPWLDLRLVLWAARFVLTGTWGKGRLATETSTELAAEKEGRR